MDKTPKLWFENTSLAIFQLNWSWTAANLVVITVTAVTTTITIAATASRMLLTNPQQDYYY